MQHQGTNFASEWSALVKGKLSSISITYSSMHVFWFEMKQKHPENTSKVNTESTGVQFEGRAFLRTFRFRFKFRFFSAHWSTAECNSIEYPDLSVFWFVFVFICKFSFPIAVQVSCYHRLCRQTFHFCSFDKKQNISQHKQPLYWCRWREASQWLICTYCYE